MRTTIKFPYSMREDGLGTCEVYEVLTGEVATVNDVLLTLLTPEEADDAVDLLNNNHLARLEGTTH